VPLPKVLLSFKEVIVPNYCNSFSHARFPDLVQYISKTIFQHIHLYQYVLTEEQPADILTARTKVEVPDEEVASLSDGLQERQFIKQKIIQELTESCESRLKEIKESGKAAMSRAKAFQQRIYEADSTGNPNRRKLMPFERLSSILSIVVEAAIEPTSLAISEALQKQDAIFNLRLQKIECLSLLNNNYSVVTKPKATKSHHHRLSSRFSQKHREFKHHHKRNSFQ